MQRPTRRLAQLQAKIEQKAARSRLVGKKQKRFKKWAEAFAPQDANSEEKKPGKPKPAPKAPQPGDED